MNNTLLFIFVYDDNSLCLKSSCDTWYKSCQKCKDLMQPLQIPFYYNQLSTCNCCRKFVLDEIEYRGPLYEKIKKCLPWLNMFKIYVTYDISKNVQRANITVSAPIERHSWLQRHLEYNSTFLKKMSISNMKMGKFWI